MSKHSSSNSDSIAGKRSSEEDESSAKKSKIDETTSLEDEANDIMEDSNNTEEPRSYILAEELFINLLDKTPKGSKKKTIYALIKTLLKLKDAITDEECEEDLDPFLKPTTSTSEIAMIQNPIDLPGKSELAGQLLSTDSPITIDKTPNPLFSAFSPTSIASAAASVSFSQAINNSGLVDSNSPLKLQLSALDACPPITSLRQQIASSAAASLPPGLTLPTVQALPGALNAQDILRVQQQMRPSEKVKMIPPQTMSPLDVQIQQKERAFHQSALQQSMGAPILPQDPDVALCETLKQKILQSINTNHNGKASNEDINRYLRQTFFMLLENNQYIYVPNPWQHKPNFVRQFMMQAQQQQQLQPNAAQLPNPPMMLPPRPTTGLSQPNQLHGLPNLANVLQPQMMGMVREGMIPPVSLPLSTQSLPLSSQSQPIQHTWQPPTPQTNILLSSLQSNSLIAAPGMQMIGSPKAGRPAL